LPGPRSPPKAPAARRRNPRPPESATDLLSSTNARLVAARRLTRRSARRETGRFLAEGAQAVREALAADAVVELFATSDAIARHPELAAGAAEISAKDAAALSQTVTPQGLVAVCALGQPTMADVLADRPRLVAALVAPTDPGNLGTVIRTADAAGADAVVLDGGVDPYNGKAVRASAGSIFHLPVVAAPAGELLAGAGRIAMTSLAATGAGAADLDDLAGDGTLAGPTVWLFGAEAHGLPPALLAAADHTVRVPIHGRAESLNLAAAAAVCLYASARAHRRVTRARRHNG
jgi:TrmH family RNA methyltransferase